MGLYNRFCRRFFAAVVVRTTAQADSRALLVHLRKNKGAGGWGEATAGEPVLTTPLWGMFYDDDAGVVSQSSEQPRKMMGAIVVVCAA